MFNKKRIKELEAKLAAYRELTDQYQSTVASMSEKISRFYDWDSDVRIISATYTITESDVNKYSASQLPRVARSRMASQIQSKIARLFAPTEILDDQGRIVAYNYDLEVREKRYPETIIEQL